MDPHSANRFSIVPVEFSDRLVAPAKSSCMIKTSAGSEFVGASETAPAQPQQHRRAAPLIVADQEIGGDVEGDVAIEEGGLEKILPPRGMFGQKLFHLGLGDARQKDFRLGAGFDLVRPVPDDDRTITDPKNGTREMHDRRVRAAENGPQFP